MANLFKVFAIFFMFAPGLYAEPVSHAEALRALTPASGKLYNGLFPGGFTGMEDDITPQQVRDYESATGSRVAWVMFSHNWFQGRAFPAQTAGWIRNQGATPYIRLMLRSDTELNHKEPLFTLKAIVRGDFDEDIAAWGAQAAQFGTPIIAEFGTEMNGDWFQWNGRWNGYQRGTALFQQAFRHIIDLTRANGASNIVWVFHVNNSDWPNRRWNRFENYYPGDDYIDWLGISIYSAQGPFEEYTVDFSQSLAGIMPRLSALAPQKPVIIAEFGTDVNNSHEPADKWADAAFTTILSGQYPNLIGFSWWNETWENDENPENATDFRVQSSPELTAVFLHHLSNSRVQGRP